MNIEWHTYGLSGKTSNVSIRKVLDNINCHINFSAKKADAEIKVGRIISTFKTLIYVNISCELDSFYFVFC